MMISAASNRTRNLRKYRTEKANRNAKFERLTRPFSPKISSVRKSLNKTSMIFSPNGRPNRRSSGMGTDRRSVATSSRCPGQRRANRLGQAERSAEFTARLLETKRSGLKIPDDERHRK